MRIKRCIVVLIICLCTILSGCIVVKNQSSATCTIVKGKSITDNYSYTVEDDFGGMKLSLNVALKEGKVKFALKDPNGEVQWSDTIEGDTTFKEERKFENITGDWTLDFESIDNSASGTINLQFNRND